MIIGVGRYRYASQADVPVAVDDAQEVRRVLQDPAICGYQPDQVQMLANKDASREGILMALEELAQRTGSDDTVFVFYCGHGAYGTDGQFYLVSHDAHLRGRRVIEGTGVSEKELLVRLKNLKSRRTLLVFNTCYSGSISPALDIKTSSLESVSLPQNSSTAILGTGSGRIIVTASSESQKSYIGTGKHSLFTQALVDGLRGEGVRDNGGFISVYDLYAYIYQRVSQTAREQLQETQEPELTVIKGVGPFAIALYHGSQTSAEFSADQMPPAQSGVHAVQPEEARRAFELKVVNTGGGAYTEGDVDTGGGSFVGRDMTVQGDHVNGDQIAGDSITVGDISGSTVAIGRGAKATRTTLLDNSALDSYFTRIIQMIRAAPQDVHHPALENTQQLRIEISRGERADDTRLATLISSLVEGVPQSAGIILELFSDPNVSWVAGDVTRFVLAKTR